MRFERIVEISPAFDRRNSDSAKDYGVHGCDLMMTLKGDGGAVTLSIFTNWHLPHVAAGSDQHPPESGAIEYHHTSPQYDGQSPATDSCPFLDGRPCYIGTSFLAAQEGLDILIRDGSDGVWRWLEEKYKNVFDMEDDE